MTSNLSFAVIKLLLNTFSIYLASNTFFGSLTLYVWQLSLAALLPSFDRVNAWVKTIQVGIVDISISFIASSQHLRLCIDQLMQAALE